MTTPLQLSKSTIDILQNFSEINPGIVIDPGTNVIKTVSRSKTIFAVAEIAETFPNEISLYKMDGLLSALSYTSKPELVIRERDMDVRGGGLKTRIVFASREVIEGFKDGIPKDINFPASVLHFNLSEENLSKMLAVSGKLGLDTLEVTRRDNRLVFRAYDRLKVTENDFEIELGDLDEETKADFRFIFRKEHFMMLPGAYSVSVAASTVARFSLVSTTTKVVYYVVTERESEYKATA